MTSFLKNMKTIMITILAGLLIFTGKAQAETLTEEPIFSVPAGFYTEEFELTITSGVATEDIYYTVDGSLPVIGNPTTYQHTAPIGIKFIPTREKASQYFCGTVIRAVAVSGDGTISKVGTASYFVDSNIFDKYKLPIISITTDNSNLYDSKIGIMSPYNNQSRGREWERPIHFEYFDKEGSLQLSMDAGIRLHGGASRDWAFKSFRIYARTEYDVDNQFEYDFFSDSVIPAFVKSGKDNGKVITKYKRLLLRNGGNEGTAGDGTLFRDALSQALVANTSLDLQAYAPAITFINGEFYGIQNIRERQDEKYIEDHYDVDENEVIIYEFSYDRQGAQEPAIVNGEDADLDFYNNMLTFIREKDLSVQENYEQLEQWMDIDNFVDYQIINIFGENGDWPGNNSKAWRVRTDYNPEAEYGLDGRIRWLLYDSDFNFGLYNSRVSTDSLANATKVGSTQWPNQDGSTLMLRKLLENEAFRIYFSQRFLDLINTNFDKDYANTLIDEIASLYETSIEEFKGRYRLLHDWHKNIETVKTFISKRDSICKMHLANKFDLGKLFFLSINTMENSKPIGGKVRVNTVMIDSQSNGVISGIWKKSYYEGIPTIISAIPEDGYEFVSWSGSSDSMESSLDASALLGDGTEVTLSPIFKQKGAQTEIIEEAPTDAVDTTPDNTDNGQVAGGDQAVTNKEDTSIFILCIVVLALIIILLIIYIVVRNKTNKKDHSPDTKENGKNNKE